MSPFDRFSVLVLCALLLVGVSGPVQAQHNHAHPSESEAMSSDASPMSGSTVLQAPGQAVFGAVQEALRRLEADSTTDWSQVDVARLRQHLLDMHRVAVHVTVEKKTSIENGVRLRVRPTTEAARASLDRVLDAHPHMVKQEAGWTMTVEEANGAYVLRTTTDDPEETAKIRALGYMGLLAYGQHHQRHHWHLVNGKHPHHDSGQ